MIKSRPVKFAITFITLIAVLGFIAWDVWEVNAFIEYKYNVFVFDTYGYFKNITLAMDSWVDAVYDNLTSIGDMSYDWSTITNSFISLANILIWFMNLALLPFQFLNMLYSLLVALLGFSLESMNNPFVELISVFRTLTIPYISYPV